MVEPEKPKYYKLPAGLMVSLFKNDSKKRYPYEPIDPEVLEIPKNISPTPYIVSLLDEFYGKLLKWETKDNIGYYLIEIIEN